MSNVLVTGADGFIGSHLVQRLVSSGFNVRAFCIYNSLGSWGWLDHINKDIQNNIEVFAGDIRDPQSVNNSLSGVDRIIHLAALIGIPYSYLSPLAYLKTNLEGTYNILESAKNCKINNILITSTSEVYGSAVKIPIDENHRLLGQSPYSASKAAADMIVNSYNHSYKLNVIGNGNICFIFS